MSTRRDIEKVKEFALGLYLQNTHSQKEIAEIVGTSENALSLWVKKEKWEKMRESTTSQRTTQISALYRQLQAINTEIEQGNKYPDSKQVNTIRYLTKSIKDLERDTTVAQFLDLGIEMVDYFKLHDPDAATNLRKLFDRYIKHKMNK
jgi:transposase